MARKSAKPKSAAKPKPGDETAPSTMREKIARLKMSRQENKKGGKFPDQKAAVSNRKGVAQTSMLRRGKQR